MPRPLIHSKPPTPDIRPTRQPRMCPAQESSSQKSKANSFDDSDDPSSSSNNHPSSSSNEDPLHAGTPDAPVLPL